MSIDAATSIGAVHLTVADLDRSIRFYQTHLGFTLQRREDQTAYLGAGGPDLLVLVAVPTARRSHGVTGLYHFAVLVPSRVELAQTLRRLQDSGTVVQGFADHGVSEAIYLSDPDGNGIEMYRDRAREKWPLINGALRMGTAALDVELLLSELRGETRRWPGLAADTRMGHVHLHVADLVAAEQFYVGVLGFDLMQRYGRAALFVSAGGYHHHVGLNTWAGIGAPAPPPGAIGLRHFEVRVPGVRALESVRERLRAAGHAAESGTGSRELLVRDPSRNGILLVANRAANGG